MNAKDESLLRSWNPCHDGLEWGLNQPSLYACFEKCDRSDWLLWLIDKAKPMKKKQSVMVAIACAERVLKNAKCKEAKVAIDAAKAWLKNPCEETLAAAEAAGASAWAAARDAAWAAWAARDAERAAAGSAAWAAWAAARDAERAAWAAARDAERAARYAAGAAAGAAEMKWQADAIRKIVKNPFKKGRK